jgi:hypothetical protein
LLQFEKRRDFWFLLYLNYNNNKNQNRGVWYLVIGYRSLAEAIKHTKVPWKIAWKFRVSISIVCKQFLSSFDIFGGGNALNQTPTRVLSCHVNRIISPEMMIDFWA